MKNLEQFDSNVLSDENLIQIDGGAKITIRKPDGSTTTIDTKPGDIVVIDGSKPPVKK